jgi:hypothetical protein
LHTKKPLVPNWCERLFVFSTDLLQWAGMRDTVCHTLYMYSTDTQCPCTVRSRTRYNNVYRYTKKAARTKLVRAAFCIFYGFVAMGRYADTVCPPLYMYSTDTQCPCTVRSLIATTSFSTTKLSGFTQKHIARCFADA